MLPTEAPASSTQRDLLFCSHLELPEGTVARTFWVPGISLASQGPGLASDLGDQLWIQALEILITPHPVGTRGRTISTPRLEGASEVSELRSCFLVGCSDNEE